MKLNVRRSNVKKKRIGFRARMKTRSRLTGLTEYCEITNETNILE